jgi:hypothetical protein
MIIFFLIVDIELPVQPGYIEMISNGPKLHDKIKTLYFFRDVFFTAPSLKLVQLVKPPIEFIIKSPILTWFEAVQVVMYPIAIELENPRPLDPIQHPGNIVIPLIKSPPASVPIAVLELATVELDKALSPIAVLKDRFMFELRAP